MVLVRRPKRLAWVMLALSVALEAGAQELAATRSQWVHFDHLGRLVYQHLKTGKRILDFSYTGYMGGGVALPDVPVKARVAPTGGDDSALIQAAIDKVSNLPLSPGSANWGIGNRGEQLLDKMKTYDPGPELPVLPQGFIESQGTPVVPASLYLEQMRERLGVQAVKNIGY
ncbi:hypothetical protein SAMN05421819_1178 [Bryocella elongata]|uniref:Uncharacterized protein n=1 Tax=Bryocella elongata TaxID=863522 RepID=A0A1H5UV72_9BACT|nr:hypothetical protein [Bryocella elongata]SEF78117.1 hypothetical protein SAMN05421819_1178 [Bryocella elongata]